MSVAQQQDPQSEMGSSFRWREDEEPQKSGEFGVNTRIMIAALVVLLVVVLFILVIHTYARWFWRNAVLTSPGNRRLSQRFRSRRRRHRPIIFTIVPPQQQQQQISKGLDKSLLQSLPVFTYRNKEAAAAAAAQLDCAVCLSEFEEGETGRRLPRCNHTFHTDCIDMWLASHSTCPLCRLSVVVAMDESEKQQQDQEQEREQRGQDGAASLQEQQQLGGLQRQQHMVIEIIQAELQDRRSNSGPPVNGQAAVSMQASAAGSSSSSSNASSTNMPKDMLPPPTDMLPPPKRSHLVIDVPRGPASPSPTQRSPLGTQLRNIRRLLSWERESPCATPVRTPTPAQSAG